MKKIITLIAGICLVFGVAGNATAAFDYGTDSSLVLSITDKDSAEMGYDLGTLDVDFNITDQQVMLANAGTIDLTVGNFVGIYAATSDWEFTFGLKEGITPEISTSNMANMGNGYQAVMGLYGHDASAVAVSATDFNSYTTRLSGGQYSGLIPNSGPDFEITLDDMAANGYVDVAMYQYLAMTDTFNEGTLRIWEDGSVELNAVPVPAAVWLLGSGLLGLVGIRRKRA